MFLHMISLLSILHCLTKNLLNYLNNLSIEISFFVYLVNRSSLFLLLNNLKDVICGHVREFVTLSFYLFDNIFIRFGSKMYRQAVGIPSSTESCFSCCRLVFIFVMRELFKTNQTDAIYAFNSIQDI